MPTKKEVDKPTKKEVDKLTKKIIKNTIGRYQFKSSRGLAQMARALGLGPRGREFESRIPEMYYPNEKVKISTIVCFG